jgi:RHS repeat-associated protein
LVEAAGQTLREYIWLDDMPIAVVADVDTPSPNLYFVHTDHLNRPIMMTDGSKNVVWQATYWPFGEAYSITGSASNNLRFPGQYFLIEDGLHYNWYRHYDPTLGRYTQPDSLGFVDGPSVYAYAKSTPAMRTDPTGMISGPLGTIQSILDTCDTDRPRGFDQQPTFDADTSNVHPLQVADFASDLESLGGGPPRLQPTSKGASQFIFPNGMVLQFDLAPEQYGRQGPHINLEYPGIGNSHIPLR